MFVQNAKDQKAFTTDSAAMSYMLVLKRPKSDLHILYLYILWSVCLRSFFLKLLLDRIKGHFHSRLGRFI